MHINGGGGAFRIRASNADEADYIGKIEVICDRFSSRPEEWVSREYVLPKDARTGEIRFSFQGRSRDNETGIDGATGFGLHSVYNSIKGMSVTPLHSKLDESIHKSVTAIDRSNASTLSKYITEIRERQISAGGSGKVAILIQGGVHANTTYPEDVALLGADIELLKRTFENVMTSNGYDLSLITFALMISPPMSQDDSNLRDLRLKARDLTVVSSDYISNFTFIDLSAITSYDAINGGGWVPPGFIQLDILTSFGYLEIGEDVIVELLKYADVAAPSSSSSIIIISSSSSSAKTSFF